MAKEVRIHLTPSQKAKIKSATGKSLGEIRVSPVGKNLSAKFTAKPTMLQARKFTAKPALQARTLAKATRARTLARAVRARTLAKAVRARTLAKSINARSFTK